MILVIDDFEQFKIFFDVVYEITDLIELQLYNDHMICSILDKGHTRFMTVRFDSAFFTVYEVDDAESVTIFAEDLHKIIKSATKIDSVRLETNDNYLIGKFESDNGNSRIFEFVLPSDEIESATPPSIEYPAKFDVSLDDLKQGIKDIGIVGSDEIRFTVNNSILSVTAGTEVSSNYVYNVNVDCEVNNALSCKFNLKYIEQILKFNKINKVVEFNIGDDMPLSYVLEDAFNTVKVTGLIAPMIEAE